jgi:hypothetical protein
MLTFTLLLSTWLATGAPAPSLPETPSPLSEVSPADETPTPYACNLDTLRSRRSCVMEAELEAATAQSGHSGNNQRLAKDLSTQLCEESSRGDGKLSAICLKEMKPAADLCARVDAAPLVDLKGRFAKASRGCYAALSEVVEKTQVMARIASSCCQCLSEQKCSGAGDQCYLGLARQKIQDSARACMENACSNECSWVTPTEPKREADEGPYLPPPPTMGSPRSRHTRI